MGFKFILRSLDEKTLPCRLSTHNSGMASGWKSPSHSPCPGELPVWAPQRTRRHTCHGDPWPDVSPRCYEFRDISWVLSWFSLPLRVIVRNKWGNKIRCVINPFLPWSHGTRDKVLWWLCHHSVQWALVFLLAQLLFPLSLITAPQFFPGEPLCHCSWFGCPPLANSWEIDPSQTMWNCPSGIGAGATLGQKTFRINESWAPGPDKPVHQFLLHCTPAATFILIPSSGLGTTSYLHIKFLVYLCEPG